MTLSLSIDERVAQQAQQVAASRGMTLDQLVHHYLQDLTSQASAEADLAELRRLSGRGSSRGWKFNREEIHEIS